MVSPKTAQKPCATDAQILHPTSCLHGDNRFASSESSPLSFRVKRVEQIRNPVGWFKIFCLI